MMDPNGDNTQHDSEVPPVLAYWRDNTLLTKEEKKEEHDAEEEEKTDS